MMDYNTTMTLEQVEKNHILEVLRYNQNNKTRTALSLGIAVNTLNSKLEKYDADKRASTDPDAPRRLGAYSGAPEIAVPPPVIPTAPRPIAATEIKKDIRKRA